MPLADEHRNVDPDAWASNPKSVFERIYQSNFDALFEYGCRFTEQSDLVKDAIQDVFVKLWKRSGQLHEIKNIKSYLLIALKNTIINKLASENSLKSKETPFELYYSFEDDLVNNEMWETNVVQLYKVLNELTDRQKECLYLRYFEGLSYEEIAELMNITVKATYKLVARALDFMKLHLSESILLLVFNNYLKE